MKWNLFPFFLFLFVGFPLFQSDQPIAWECLVSDNSLIIKSGSDSPLDETLGPDSKKTVPNFLSLIRFISQVKNPLSVLTIFSQGTSPFWRPPPIEYSIHGYGTFTHDEIGIS
jgi:hypothetical protein